jgi:hypothetical protein
MRPDSNAVKETFRRHYEQSAKQTGEMIIREYGAERSTAVSYSGRTVFELLQNALDRSEHRVLLELTDADTPLLVVGNDGPGVGVDPHFDYDPSRAEARVRRRSDFHALCSLHTSNKSPDESIGSKGIGFRSVFSLGSQVQVWSRLADGPDEWWGLELREDFTGTDVQRRMREDPAVRRGVEWVGALDLPKQDDQRPPRPSFYFPLPLRASGKPLPVVGVETLETLVAVPLGKHGARKETVDELGELKRTHLCFVGLRQGKGEIRVVVKDGNLGELEKSAAWAPEASDIEMLAAWRSPPPEAGPRDLAEKAQEANYALSRPGVAIAWPKSSGDDSQTTLSRLIYEYLPTRVTSPVAIDIHGDFQLEPSRRSLNDDEGSPVGRYNTALLETAAELHLVSVLTALGLREDLIRDFPREGFRHIGEPSMCQTVALSAAPRVDIFELLTPRIGSGEKNPFIDHLERLIFGDAYDWDTIECWERWAELAACRFGDVQGSNLGRGAYDAFWQASKEWLDRAGAKRKRSRPKYIERCAEKLGDALRERRTRVVPLLDDDSEAVDHSVPLPERRTRGEGGGRLARRLFLRSAGETVACALHLPKIVLDRGRAVTSYPLRSMYPDVEQTLGITPFARWDLLVDLRQLPTRAPTEPEAPAPEVRSEPGDQLELLRFVAELFVAHFGSNKPPAAAPDEYGWGWRASAGSLPDEQLRAGRALATLFLRTKDGTYEPARQLDRERIDTAWLAPLVDQVQGLDLDQFLVFLGVSPIPGLHLVEGGEEGVVDPLDRPPGLVDADGRGSNQLELLIRKPNDALLDSVLEAWDALSEAIESERHGRRETGIVDCLSRRAWLPCNMPGFQSPRHLTTPPQYVAPRDVVLTSPMDRRRAVLFSLDRSIEPLRTVLEALNAMSLEREKLECRDAEPALRLLEQLTHLDCEAVAHDSQARQALTELFQNLLDAIVERAPASTAPPLLTYEPAPDETALSERRFRWQIVGEPAHIASDNSDRETIRRFFPGEPLVTATLGEKVVTKLPGLANRAAKVSLRVQATAPRSDEGAESVRRQFDELLPGLLALAEVSRQIPGGLKFEDAERRWHGLRIERADNVWYEIDFESRADGKKLHATWLDNSSGDVVVDGQRIVFDMPGREEGHPPLRAFAAALAEAGVGNPTVAGIFALALAEYDAGPTAGSQGDAAARFRKYLQKQGADRLAEAYRRALHPLTPAEVAMLRAAVEKALANVDLTLRPERAVGELPRDLTLDDVLPASAGGYGDLTEQHVQNAISGAQLPKRVDAFLPHFTCSSQNRAVWRAWVDSGSKKDRLLALAESLAGGSGAASAAGSNTQQTAVNARRMQQLEEVALDLFSRLDFSPAVAACHWLGELGIEPPFSAQDLERNLPESARYREVTDLQGRSECRWEARSLMPTGPVTREMAPETADNRQAKDVNKGVIGLDAEKAFVPWVAKTTRDVLRTDGPVGWHLLAEATKEWNKVTRNFEAARNAGVDEPGLLERALHVSAENGAAGFDLLGLERDKGGNALLVRYECKALPVASQALVYISRNEIAAFRSLPRDGSNGEWKLIGIYVDGTASDLTHHLDSVRDDSVGPLADLANKGLGVDSLTLTIEQVGVIGQKGS